MPAQVGLRLVLTICGFLDFIIPHTFSCHLGDRKQRLDEFYSHLQLRLKHTRQRSRVLLIRAKKNIIKKLCPATSPLLSLPAETRLNIYEWVCTPQPDGTVPNAHHLLLINRQIYLEAAQIFDCIEHKIRIGDLERYNSDSIEFMGLPRLTKIDEKLDWHMTSLKHLALEVSICGIGKMTPDCFDVYIAHNGKEQWRNLKRLIGIWPHPREVPLQSVRLELRVSDYDPKNKQYRADFIRVIRNFKRTKVWAETGDCSQHKCNTSMLLPLVRAFNQGRRNWEKESDSENNLIVRYDKQMLKKSPAAAEEGDEEEEYQAARQRWSIVPTADTSRSDNSVWPEWTGKEEKYISEKMINRGRTELDQEIECPECLACFDRPWEMKDHVRRGRWRSQT